MSPLQFKLLQSVTILASVSVFLMHAYGDHDVLSNFLSHISHRFSTSLSHLTTFHISSSHVKVDLVKAPARRCKEANVDIPVAH